MNSFIVAALVDLDAAEVAPVIERAFAADVVEWEVCGDWEDVQVGLGLLAQRRTPRPPYVQRPGSQLASWERPGRSPSNGESLEIIAASKAKKKKKKKTKARKRMAKASQRRNRRRK